MEEKIFSGQNADQIWQQIESEFILEPDPLEYRALINQDSRCILFYIDIDPGGGFEGGYAITSFSSPIANSNDFRFAIHEEDFLDELGKFFGMEDVKLDYAEFDKKYIVKTTDTERVRNLFSDSQIRKVLTMLDEASMHIGHHHLSDSDSKSAYLELKIESGITDVKELRSIYKAFYHLLQLIDPLN